MGELIISMLCWYQFANLEIRCRCSQPLNVNLVVKALPKKAARRKLFRSDIFFRNEINFYKKVLPAFEKFQKGTKAKNPFNEYPQYYASHCDGVNDFLALRDISELGYGAASR